MLRPRLRTRHLLLAGAIALTTAPASAQAASCSATDGATLTSALANASCDSIILAAGTYTSSSGFTAPARAVTITGPGATLATITRTGAGDVLTVPAGATLGLSGVTMGGATSGAGLKVTGTGIASLTSDVISGNTSPASGAGIAFSGQTLTVANSRISGNASSADGGGVENSSALGTATFHEVLFTQNTSTGSGGGGAIDTSGVAAVTNLKNATLTNNHANVDGGAVRSGQAGASTTLNNVTIAGNVANDDNSGGGDGGGMSNSAGSITIANSIVANNSALGGAPDCDSAVASPVTRSGYELIRNATGCSFGGEATAPPDISPLSIRCWAASRVTAAPPRRWRCRQAVPW